MHPLRRTAARVSAIAATALAATVVALVTPTAAHADDLSDYFTSFNTGDYLDMNPDLASLRGCEDKRGTVTINAPTPTDCVEDHFLASLDRGEARPTDYSFDARVYRALNDDLAARSIRDLHLHYNAVGYREPRSSSLCDTQKARVFDPGYYPAANTDLPSTWSSNQRCSHFVAFGLNEGRQGTSTFNVNTYRAANPDLVASPIVAGFDRIPGVSNLDLALHWLKSGAVEGRRAT